MANSLNKVMIIGNLGRDPEMRYMPNGKAVTNFSVAVGRNTRSADGEMHEDTEWFNIVMFEKLAEISNQYLTKGQKVYVEGRLQSRSWDGNDGQKHYRTEVVANQMIMLSPKGAGAPRDEASFAGGFQDEPAMQSGGDDLPF
ncbi:MAG TPA: single-stranded DNA-binding protein [Chloroflexota bacterium]|nr:single-stranded DNA-binding protein [Chloroflexota bacterium]